MDVLRIVIVDDEPLARAVLREYAAAESDLEVVAGCANGFEVAGGGLRGDAAAESHLEVVADCANGFEAVKAVADLKPDLVLLDVQMPKLDGFEVLQLLGRGQPVL